MRVDRGVLRQVAVRLHRGADWPPAWDRHPGPAPAAALYAVYRKANAPVLARLIADWPAVRPSLWALDEVSPMLAHATVGHGPGLKFELLNRLHEAVPPAGRWTVFSDDDFAVVRGSLDRWLAVADQAGFGLSQPAHIPDSYWTHRATVAQPRTVARRTRFVEIGPVFAISPVAQVGMLPFPSDVGMGYGLERRWAAVPGLRQGIVDSTRIRHLDPIGRGYIVADELERVGTLAEDNVARNTTSLGRPWRPWQREPRWD